MRPSRDDVGYPIPKPTPTPRPDDVVEVDAVMEPDMGLTPLPRDDVVPVNCNGAGLCRVGVVGEGSNDGEEGDVNLFRNAVELDEDER